MNTKNKKADDKSSWLENTELPQIRYSMEFREGLSKTKPDGKDYWDSDKDSSGDYRRHSGGSQKTKPYRRQPSSYDGDR
jgi:hypothetical protein